VELPPLTSAAELFGSWLKRGDPRDIREFDALLAAHPEQAAALRELRVYWSALEGPIRAVLEPTVPADVLDRLFLNVVQSRTPEEAANVGTTDFVRRPAVTTRTRLRVEEEIGRGGMGSILRVFDEDLRRTLAMKVALRGDEQDEPARIARFLEEAQVTSQLDHPGVVPVHELGLDAHGRPFFTMKLVKGRDLRTIYDLVFEGREGWTETRAVAVFLRVCEAVAYAHRKGVIHRDLKPANVMVGDLGEVYVMDWGLARTQGRPDSRDLRIAPHGSSRSVRTDRREEREETPDSPIVTMDGTVVGTPAYMPPEQARGESRDVDTRSDVYAIGAMLYHLLARRMPFVPSEGRVSNRTVLARLLDGAPRPIAELRANAPAELVAICEKAMSREAALRYADTLELAEDLRAYLEGRVVRAHEGGRFAELRKWTRRNRALAVTGASALLFVVLGLGAVSWVQAARNRDLGRANQEIRGLSDMKLLQDLRAEADTLWPALPARVPDLERWIARATDVTSRRPQHATAVARMSAAAPLLTDPESRWFDAAMRDLIAAIHAFEGSPESLGLISDVRGRLDFARTIEERSVSGARESALWRTCIEAVRTSPLYGGLELKPRTGLLPLGADPTSHLQEFAHLASGRAAERASDGTLSFEDDSGIVLVLVPSGTFVMGAVNDPSSPEHDAMAKPAESPPMTVTLDAFYVAKHEMTQAQWTQIAGNNPSNYQTDVRMPPRLGPRNPVERVSWEEARMMLERLDLSLPTEAQWEYAARAGTRTSWWTGNTIESLANAGNLADATSRREGPEQWPHNDSLDDGAVVHTRVGSYRANPFGLHDTIGNVAEWCQDLFLLGEAWSEPQDGAGARDAGGASLLRVSRGGAFAAKPEHARSAHRSAISPSQRLHDTGVRAAVRIR